MELLDKIMKFIDNFNPTDIGSIITLAAVMCILTVYCIRAVYTTSIEEIFMDAKKKLKNDILKLLSILVVFIPTNFLLATDVSFILIEIVVCVIGFITYIIYKIKERKTEKYKKTLCKLQTYYIDKQMNAILMMVICVMPAMVILWKSLYNTMPLFGCAVIVSVIEVAIIGISIPDLFLKKATNYFKNGQEKIFIYKRTDDDTVICGDNENISKASKYIVISLEDLKSKEIYHQQYKSISKDEKNGLCKEMKVLKKSRKK